MLLQKLVMIYCWNRNISVKKLQKDRLGMVVYSVLKLRRFKASKG